MALPSSCSAGPASSRRMRVTRSLRSVVTSISSGGMATSGGLFDVTSQLLAQVFHPRERACVAQTRHAIHAQILAVQIPAEIDHMDLDLARLLTERRVGADVRRAAPRPPLQIDADGVDPVAG